MKYLLSESQLKNLLKKEFNLDLTQKIYMVQSKYDLPSSFRWLDQKLLNQYLNKYGPMFVIKHKNMDYLVQNHGNSKEDNWVIADERDNNYDEWEFMRKLGIEVLGLKLKTLIDDYFVEELNESVEEDDKMEKVVQSYLDMNLKNYYGIKRFWVDYNEQFDRYDVNIFFDKQLAIEMGGGINMLRRRALSSISEELNNFFEGLTFSFYEHYED